MNEINWTKMAPGVWAAKIGVPDDLNPFAVVDSKPRIDALNEMGDIKFPINRESINVDYVDNKLVIKIPLGKDEKIYGLGLQFMKMNQRGRTRYLRVNSDSVQNTGETHAPVPFYVSSKGYGLLVNTSRIVTIYCGSCTRRETPQSDYIEIVLSAAGVELYIFAGKSMLDVVRRYNLYCGGGALPPRWGLGFWYQVPINYKDKQVIEEALEFRKRDYPCDVIVLEPEGHNVSSATTYEWSKERYPEPKEFVEKMLSEGFHINLWENPYVSPSSKIFSKLEPLSGSHTVQGGLAPDYSLPDVQDILKKQHEKEHIDIGVSGYKLDECNGSKLTGGSWMFPAHAVFPSGHNGEHMRQLYGLMLQKMTYDIFHSRDKRTYGLVRTSCANASSMPYVLYSDAYDLRQFVRALCNASFCGLLWAPEVRNVESAEEWVRRIQVACFSPLAMINAWADGPKPWSYPEVESIVKKYMKLRMQLMPYLYSIFAKYYFDGTPPFRAMQLEVGNVKAESRTRTKHGSNSHYTVHEDVYSDIDDQYMVGDYMLVAPLFPGEESREVYLPEGNWYDFETGEYIKGGRKIKVSPGLESIPVFVREGAVIPMMSSLPHAPGPKEAVPLEVRHYGNIPGSFMLFDDDGESFAYERGEYRWIVLRITISPIGAKWGSISNVDKGWASSYKDITWKFIR